MRFCVGKIEMFLVFSFDLHFVFNFPFFEFLNVSVVIGFAHGERPKYVNFDEVDDKIYLTQVNDSSICVKA